MPSPQKRERITPLKGALAQQTQEMLEDDAVAPQIVYQDREVRVEVPVEVTRPVATDEQGVTWVGNIGMSSTGLILDTPITEQEWYDFLNVIRDVKRSWQFIIGDWFAYGADKFEYTYERIAALTGYKVSTVEAFASTCRNVPRFTRVNSLSFSHHRAVSVLPAEQQVQALREAELRRLSSRELHALISGKKPRLGAGKNASKKEPQVVDRKLYNRVKNSDDETRRKVAEQLRRMANELYPEDV